MRILYLCQRVPYPPTRGDKIPTFHQIRHLAKHHHVTVACLADGVEDLANVEGLAPYVQSVDAVPIDRWRACCRALLALLCGLPFTRGYFHERRLQARIDALVAANYYDAIVVSSSGMAQYVESIADVPRVMQFVDLDSQKWRMYAGHARAPWRWLYAWEATRLLAYERWLASTFELSVVVTEHEAEDFRRLMPGTVVTCVPNGVDVDAFQPMPDVQRIPRSLVFVGVMDYWPNELGAIWLCETILPLLRRTLPDVTVTVCGARPTRRVRALSNIPGVTVTGAVADVRPFMAAADACVVPVPIARGVQNKVLEAMAMAMPAIVTRPAFIGLDATADVHLLVADDERAFARNVIRCLTDQPLRERLGRAGRTLVLDRYRWEGCVAKLEAALVTLTGCTRSERIS
jgi:sugar transferase (PEP-CTERM/EpsH1 system associated)